MGGPSPRIGLNLKVAQKQILTPGLVQMVSVLALNKLELREMINQEMIANPVLEEVPRTCRPSKKWPRRPRRRSPPPLPPSIPPSNGDRQDSFEEIDFGSFFDDYLDPGYKSPAAEVIEKPSFENFLSQPTSLSDHLEWQLSLSICSDEVREAGHSIIGNLNEDGYLTATLEEIAQSGNHQPAHVAEALTLDPDV